jgi:hypothetical protein
MCCFYYWNIQKAVFRGVTIMVPNRQIIIKVRALLS